MSGRTRQFNITISILLWILLVMPGRSFATTGGPAIVLLSASESAYAGPVDSFTSSIQRPVKIFNLQGDLGRAPEIMQKVLAEQPSLIFALGAKAAYVAKTWTADRRNIPVLFAMVLNWERYDLLAGQDNIAGIANDMDPGLQFANMSLLVPRVKRIGVIYSKEYSAHLVENAEKAAARLGITLVTEPISRPEEFRRAYKKLADQIDSFWIVADPIVYSLENISWLERICLKEKLTCIGPSKNIASQGILLAVDPDQKSIGIQAASLSNNIISGKILPGKIGVMSPLGSELYLNMETARKIELSIPETALDLIRKVID